MTLQVKLTHPRATVEMLGHIPDFLDTKDPRPAKEQLHSNYGHGGGWNKFEKMEMRSDGDLQYPGDPPFERLGEMQLRDETIAVFNHAWVAIIQKDGSYEVAHMD